VAGHHPEWNAVKVKSPAAGRFDPLVYWERRLNRNFGPGGVGCLGLSEAYNRLLYRVRRAAVRRAILSVHSDWHGQRVLDIGSGTGFWIEQWQRIGVGSVVGSDFTTESVARLRERWGDAAIVSLDITGSDVGVPGRFDAVSAFDVLFHIVHDDAYARVWWNVAALLRPGGVFLFTENFLRGQAEHQPHLVSRTLPEIVRYALGAGFEILDRRPVFVLMNRPIDSGSPALRWWWRGLERMARREGIGSVIGHALYPLEVALTSILRQGPSTELMICRKV
jgi:SAM-dependent methyltransferase